MSQINQILNNDWLSNAETLFTKIPFEPEIFAEITCQKGTQLLANE